MLIDGDILCKFSTYCKKSNCMVIDKPKVESRTDWIRNLYLDYFPNIAAYISRSGGNLDEAKDIFQEALIIYYEKCLGGKELTNEKAYLLGIAKHLWYNRLKELARHSELDGIKPEPSAEEELSFSAQKVLNLLKDTGQKCMDMLEAFYYQKISLKALAPKLGLAGERSAAVQKYKCLEKVRDIVKSKGLSYEDFAE